MGDFWHKINDTVPSFVVGAIIFLVIGWIIAVILSKIVTAGLRKTGLDRRLARLLGGDNAGTGADTAEVGGRLAFYLIMLLVLIGVLDRLKLPLATQPLNDLLGGIFGYIPRLLGAAILIVLAWLIATILRTVVYQLLRTGRADERLGVQPAEGQTEPTTFSRSLSEIAYGIVFLLFLPMILDALQLPGLLVPVQRLLNTIFGFIPNIIAAALIVIIGWFVARFIARLVTNLLAAIGTDRFSERVGLAKALGAQKLSKLIGLLVYVLIIIPVIIAGLNALQLASVTDPASHMLNEILNIVPKALAAGAIVAIAYIIGRVVAGLVTNLLTGFGFNRLPARIGLPMGGDDAAGGWTASRMAGAVVFAAFLWFAVIEALQVLGLSQVTDLLARLIVLAGHILLGLIIIAIGVFVARLIARAIRGSSAAHAGLLAFVAEVAAIALFGAMGLRQMGLANEIINLAFGILLAAIGIALAIAFGVGGRFIAGDQLERWVRSTWGSDGRELAGATSGGGGSSSTPLHTTAGAVASGPSAASAPSSTRTTPHAAEDGDDEPPNSPSGGPGRPPTEPAPGSGGGTTAISSSLTNPTPTAEESAIAQGRGESSTETAAASSTTGPSTAASAIGAADSAPTARAAGTLPVTEADAAPSPSFVASAAPSAATAGPAGAGAGSITESPSASLAAEAATAPESSAAPSAAGAESLPSDAAGTAAAATPGTAAGTDSGQASSGAGAAAGTGEGSEEGALPSGRGKATETSGSTAALGTAAGTGTRQPSGGPATAPAGATTDRPGAIERKGSRDCPSSHPIKGNASSMIYHLPGERDYRATVPEMCFATEADAVAAGYRPIRRFGAEAQRSPASAPESRSAATSATSGTTTPGAAGASTSHPSQAAAGSAAGAATDRSSAGPSATPSGTTGLRGAVEGTGTRDCPAGYPIKGNASSMIFHQPGERYYNVTIPELCFATEEDAVAAGYRPYKHAPES